MRDEDEGPVDLWPHMGACGIGVMIGMALDDWRLILTTLLTLVAFLSVIALVAHLRD